MTPTQKANFSDTSAPGPLGNYVRDQYLDSPVLLRPHNLRGSMQILRRGPGLQHHFMDEP